MPPRFSVVIPTHNRASVLPRALQSVRQQTAGDLEVIVVDDASTDDTEAVVQNASVAAPLHYVRHSTNRGGAAARNTGLRRARGKWVAFLDSDDAWLPDKLERQRDALASHPDASGSLTGDVVYRNGQADEVRFARPLSASLRPVLLRTCVGSTSSFVARRSCLRAVGGFDAALPSCQDWDLFLRFSNRFSIAHVPHPLVAKHADGSGISRDASAYVAGYRRFLDKHREAIRAQGSDARAHHALRLGRLCARAGALGAARRAFRRGMQHRPWLPRFALHWAATHLGADGYAALVRLVRRSAASAAALAHAALDADWGRLPGYAPADRLPDDAPQKAKSRRAHSPSDERTARR
jgi:glycosyltransferase involved in cell wall biosynthesis